MQTKELYEITMKKIDSNPLSIYRLSVGFEGLNREEASARAMEISEKLGLMFHMSYIIRGFREEA